MLRKVENHGTSIDNSKTVLTNKVKINDLFKYSVLINSIFYIFLYFFIFF